MFHYQDVLEIMLKIKKSKFGGDSIIFYFSVEDACILRDKCLEVLRCGEVEIPCEVNLKNRQEQTNLTIRLSGDECFFIKKRPVVLCVDEESINIGCYLLDGYIKDSYFPVAEFMSIKGDERSSLQLYFYKADQ
ncbi:hypothetical protein [Parachitinimonas caeni]|uniref:Uncharacterized protein n=1 Tax=Parachitinimonas caeni TaxID=3031301 RepID=A0ABT7E6P7_9NEIS|nr:hypothetical protein [Parachitinimonas caeni]MDK2127028.1 hypothetical protein [Parachitinimonas caeni]